MARNRTTISTGEGGASFAWIDVTDADQDDATALVDEFHLPAEITRLIGKEAHRPFINVLEDVAGAVIKTAEWDDGRKALRIEEIRVLVVPGAVVTVDYGTGIVDHVREDLQQHPQLGHAGPQVVMALTIAHAAKICGMVLGDLTDEVTDVETTLFTDERARPTRRIYRLTREVLELRRIVGPMADMLDELQLLGDEEPSKALRRRLSQGRSHATRLVDTADSLNNQLTNALQANLTEVSVRQNDDMRRISAYAALAAVPTLIAGVYGMNFRHMPELDWTYGYPMAVVLMLALVSGLAWVFKRSGWM